MKGRPIILFIVFLASQGLSCNCVKNPRVSHIDFCDFVNIVYALGDSTHVTPLKDVSLHFLVDSENTKCLEEGFFKEVIAKDSGIQREILQKDAHLVVTFYKVSTATKELVKTKNTKYLAYCNDDIIVEFTWSDGALSDIYHYKNGRIEGSEKIKFR